MSQLHRVPLSLRMVVRGLVFLAQMWASEWRFRLHARLRQHHQAATARHLDGMTDELEFRVALCARRSGSAGTATMSGSSTRRADASSNGRIIDRSSAIHCAETGGGRG